MLESYGFPTIKMLFSEESHPMGKESVALANKLVRQLLDSEIFSPLKEDPEAVEEVYASLLEKLPIVSWTTLDLEPPFVATFYCFNKLRPNAFKFFFDMISRWLVPGKLLNVINFHSFDMRFPLFGEQTFTLSAMMLKIESADEHYAVFKNLPILVPEIELGVSSAYYARRIMEVKGLVADEKTAMIQEYVTYLVERLPQAFERDVFSEMQNVLVHCREPFKAVRESRHLSRIIGVYYLFRKDLQKAIVQSPNKHHLRLKVVKTTLHLVDGPKKVLGLIIGLNFLKDKEILEERHIIRAIRNIVPNAELVPESFFQGRRPSELIATFYVEVEKADEKDFTTQEIQRIRRELPVDLKERIEQLMHPIFMPRNEEEIMRNILILSNQLRYLRDIPQVMISFDEQTDLHLSFTIICLRVLREGSFSIEELFKRTKTPLEYFHDRTRIVGLVRKKCPKESSVFRVKLTKERFLRGDHSIDLYRARRFVSGELTRVIGEFRDYNGGMISKQDELLSAVRALLEEKGHYNDLLLENFFYSLSPVIMRSVLAPNSVYRLFLMLTDAVEEGFFNQDSQQIKSFEEKPYYLVMVTSDDPSIKELLSQTVAALKIPSTQLATAFIAVYDTYSVGYIYRSEDPIQQKEFFSVIEQAFSSV